MKPDGSVGNLQGDSLDARNAWIGKLWRNETTASAANEPLLLRKGIGEFTGISKRLIPCREPVLL